MIVSPTLLPSYVFKHFISTDIVLTFLPRNFKVDINYYCHFDWSLTFILWVFFLFDFDPC